MYEDEHVYMRLQVASLQAMCTGGTNDLLNVSEIMQMRWKQVWWHFLLQS